MKQLLILITAVLGLFILGCNETIPIGSGVLPIGDSPESYFNDTTTIFSRTVREDSMRTDKLFFPQMGYTVDPTFGPTSSSATIGFRTPSQALDYESLGDTIGGYYLDSIFLALIVDEIYGDTNKRMSFTVYQQAQPLDQDALYYSTSKVNQGMVEVGRLVNVYPSATNKYDEDSVNVDNDPQMRIPLDPFFGQSLLNILGTNVIYSNDLFKQYLPGLIVVPQEQAGSMIELNLVTNTITSNITVALSDTRIHMYYKNGVDTSLRLIFPATALDVGVSTYDHQYASTNVEAALNSTDPEGDPVNYIQGLAGVKTKIDFPYVDAYSESSAILKAEIVITRLLDGSEEEFPPPERLLVVKVGEDGENENISDFTSLPVGHFGGYGEEVILDNGEVVLQYRINISDYFQQIVLGQVPNDGLYITTYGAQNFDFVALNDSDLIPDRIVIAGGNNTNNDYKLKLDLTYSVLE